MGPVGPCFRSYAAFFHCLNADRHGSPHFQVDSHSIPLIEWIRYTPSIHSMCNFSAYKLRWVKKTESSNQVLEHLKNGVHELVWGLVAGKPLICTLAVMVGQSHTSSARYTSFWITSTRSPNDHLAIDRQMSVRPCVPLITLNRSWDVGIGGDDDGTRGFRILVAESSSSPQF